MLNNLATIFSGPPTTRKYPPQPPLSSRLLNRPPAHPKLSLDTTDLLQSLTTPIEQWIVQKQPHLSSLSFQHALLGTICAHSSRSKAQPRHPLTVHNLFVMVVQYRVLNATIEDLTTSEVEMVVDGACGVYLRHPHSIDELSCLLHFILKNWRGGYIPSIKAQKPIDFDNSLANLIKVYGQLPHEQPAHLLDLIVQAIPFVAHLLHLGFLICPQSQPSSLFSGELAYLGCIPFQLMGTLLKDINQLLPQHHIMANQFQLPFCHTNPTLRQQLHNKYLQLTVNSPQQHTPEEVASTMLDYGLKEVYFFPHVIKMTSFMGTNCTAMLETLRIIVKLCNQHHLDFMYSLQEKMEESLARVLKADPTLTSHLPPLTSPALLSFMEGVDGGMQWGDMPQDTQPPDTSLLGEVITGVLGMKVEMLPLLLSLIENSPAKTRKEVQFYVVMVGAMECLVEKWQEWSKLKASPCTLLSLLGRLVQGQPHLHRLLNLLLGQYSQFITYVHKHFLQARHLLTLLLIDATTISLHKFASAILSQLLNTSRPPSQFKHHVWVSYIHEVIIPGLLQRPSTSELQAQWVTVCILLQAEHTQRTGGRDMDLGQLIMKYLSNMLTQALQWKHSDETALMRRIVQTHSKWERHYTNAMMESAEGRDAIEEEWGSRMSYLVLRKWNRRIVRAVEMFIQSVQQVPTPVI